MVYLIGMHVCFAKKIFNLINFFSVSFRIIIVVYKKIKNPLFAGAHNNLHASSFPKLFTLCWNHVIKHDGCALKYITPFIIMMIFFSFNLIGNICLFGSFEHSLSRGTLYLQHQKKGKMNFRDFLI